MLQIEPNWRQSAPSLYSSLLTTLAESLTPLTGEQVEEWEACRTSCQYFITTHVRIYDATRKVWLPFELWPAQEETLRDLLEHREVIALKARQLGFTWLVLAYALWLMMFHPAATVLMFSKRDEEAIELLDFRMKGMHRELPQWMRLVPRTDHKHNWLLANGSRALAFPTTGGRSYTGTLVIVDEADFLPDLDKLMNAVQPTVDAGGQLVLLSTSDKDQPESPFKRIYRAARQKLNTFKAIFYGWRARPGRTEEWYEARRADVLSRTGALDDLHQEYPATDTEALSPRSLDKRIAPAWIELCYEPLDALSEAVVPNAPTIPGLRLYRQPQFGVEYVMGADPAEGNPRSDDSSLHIVERGTGEEVGQLAGKLEPDVFASYIRSAGIYFNRADVLVERNNHGHAVLLWLRDNASEIGILRGDDKKPGWLSNSVGKVKMYDEAALAFRQHDTRLHSLSTYTQLASIEAATLRAPENQMEDEADSYALALLARSRRPPTTSQSNYMTGQGGPGVASAPSPHERRGLSPWEDGE